MQTGVLSVILPISYDSRPQDLTTIAAVNIESLCDCFEYLSTDSESVFLVNQEDECIVSAGTPWRQRIIDCWPAVNTAMMEGSEVWASADMGKMYIVYRMVPSVHWYLVKMTSTALFERDIIQLRVTTIFSTLALMSILMIIYMFWSHRPNRSMNIIISAMNEMRSGDLTKRIPERTGIQEFDLIREQFNDMADSIGQLMNKARIRQLRVRKSLWP